MKNKQAEPTELEKRIEAAEQALASYPQWVRDNNYFSGGTEISEDEFLPER